jgi:hypothetical protein
MGPPLLVVIGSGGIDAAHEKIGEGRGFQTQLPSLIH